jgi:hypothetical protein
MMTRHVWLPLLVTAAQCAAARSATAQGAATQPAATQPAAPQPATAAPSPEAVVRAYTEAANRHDLEAFLSHYAPTIRKYRFPGQLASEGIEHNRRAYTRSFRERSDIRVEIVEMITLGDKVMVRDRVTGLPDGRTADELTLYQVENGRITNIVYVERQVR